MRNMAGWGMMVHDQYIFENELSFTDSHSGGGGGINILRLHDIVMYHMVDPMSALSLQGSGCF